MIRDQLVYLREFVSTFQSTGTVCSTSRWAADALAAPLLNADKPQRILEVGAGTGAVTARIMNQMRPEDELVVCEMNPRLVKQLKRRFSKSSKFATLENQVSFFEGLIQDLPEDGKYDLIVCALPFLNFELELVEEIFAKLRRLSHSDTVMTYYEYIGIRMISCNISPRDRKRRIRELDEFFKGLFAQSEIGRTRVWRNVLPINIYTLQVAA